MLYIFHKYCPRGYRHQVTMTTSSSWLPPSPMATTIPSIISITINAISTAIYFAVSLRMVADANYPVKLSGIFIGHADPIRNYKPLLISLLL